MLFVSAFYIYCLYIFVRPTNKRYVILKSTKRQNIYNFHLCIMFEIHTYMIVKKNMSNYIPKIMYDVNQLITNL